MGKMEYIGNCTYKGNVKSFFALGQEEWLKRMQSSYRFVSPFALDIKMVRSWQNCFSVLHNALQAMPEEYKKLQIIFEYVMPLARPDLEQKTEYNGVRADVLLLSKDTVTVLEFKNRSDPMKDKPELLKWYVRQAWKYRKRLQR